ncbi:MAG: hypothetical protein IPJ71_15820 [Bdellovibrionales bacterium]|nr:hypothetical protein [Bdellovibrionales bacterium]
MSNIESKSLELSDGATSIDSVGVDLLKRSKPHASLPFAKEFEHGWIEFPFKQDECRSVSFLQTGDSSQVPADGTAAPTASKNVDQKATQFPRILVTSQIVEKSQRSIVYDFMVGKSITRYRIYAQGADSMLIKIASYRPPPSHQREAKKDISQPSNLKTRPVGKLKKRCHYQSPFGSDLDKSTWRRASPSSGCGESKEAEARCGPR